MAEHVGFEAVFCRISDSEEWVRWVVKKVAAGIAQWLAVPLDFPLKTSKCVVEVRF